MEGTGKQAVLLIHGIGEQHPMDSLPGFVEAVWTSDASVHHPHAKPGVWSKPDTISGNFELRRLTTSANADGVRTDFYEFYWQHLMQGNSLGHVSAWARVLLLRWPWKVPRRLLLAWLLLVACGVLVLAFLGLTVVPAAHWPAWVPPWLSPWVSGGAAALVAGLAIPTLRNVVGDAARYLHPAPANIERRQEIRAKGVALIGKLHDAGYERIVVVGHSLGSVIGYDVLTYAWATYHASGKGVGRSTGSASERVGALGQLEEAIAAGDPEAYRGLQRALHRELREAEHGWRVTDFVTLGSPLAHADVLLAPDAARLAKRQAIREFPTCPPTTEDGLISFPKDRVKRTLHHGAVFGPCRWTNLYFPVRLLLHGDVIGGPLAGLFGWGVRDLPVRTRRRLGFLSHTLYWKPGLGTHVETLRAAVNLLDRDAG